MNEKELILCKNCKKSYWSGGSGGMYFNGKDYYCRDCFFEKIGL